MFAACLVLNSCGDKHCILDFVSGISLEKTMLGSESFRRTCLPRNRNDFKALLGSIRPTKELGYA